MPRRLVVVVRPETTPARKAASCSRKVTPATFGA